MDMELTTRMSIEQALERVVFIVNHDELSDTLKVEIIKSLVNPVLSKV